jgi:hypothetical protein
MVVERPAKVERVLEIGEPVRFAIAFSQAGSVTASTPPLRRRQPRRRKRWRSQELEG